MYSLIIPNPFLITNHVSMTILFYRVIAFNTHHHTAATRKSSNLTMTCSVDPAEPASVLIALTNSFDALPATAFLCLIDGKSDFCGFFLMVHEKPSHLAHTGTLCINLDP